MNMAMIPGIDPVLGKLQDQVLARCPRCDWRFIACEGDTHCPDCTQNPLWDRDEEMMLARKHRSAVFEFMGWKFGVTNIASANEPCYKTFLMCWKRLFNPEHLGEVYSQSSFLHTQYEMSLYRGMPDRLILHHTRKCAAWLIAHWWEHYLEICPCLNGERDDREDSNFRRAVIESLLWYDEHVVRTGE